MSQPSAKEIAERIVKLCGDLRKCQQLFEFDKQFETLARAYLELERKYYELGECEIQNTIHLETHLAEIHKRGEEIDRLESEITKLKEENAQLSKYCGEVRAWQNRAEDLSEELERLKK